MNESLIKIDPKLVDSPVLELQANAGDEMTIAYEGDDMAFWATDDPILSEDERTHDCFKAGLKECEACGNEVDRLTYVEDRDDSVGYCNEIAVCDNCVERRHRR